MTLYNLWSNFLKAKVLFLPSQCELYRFKAYSMYPRVMPFWIYTTVSFFKTFSPLPLCVCVCVCVKILSILKRKNNGLISYWKMSVSYRGLKLVLCFKTFSPCVCVCVCVKILSILKKKKQWVDPTLENECEL